MKHLRFGRGDVLTFEEWIQRLESSLSYHQHRRIHFGLQEWLKRYFDKRWTVCEVSERLRGRIEIEFEKVKWEAPNTTEKECLAFL